MKLHDLLQYKLKSVRAYLLKEQFQQLWENQSPTWAGRFLDAWCTQTLRSRIEPMKRFARTMRTHHELEQIHKKMLEHTRLATIGQTASVLAHEMRNPLASIKLALSGLGAYEELPERAQRRIALVSGEVDRLDDLLSQTLDYARPIKFSPHPVAMDSIIGRVIEQQKPLLEHTGVRVEWQKCTKCLLRRVDENLLYQALLNVLKNAIEASPKGGVVRIDVDELSDAVILTVTNQGEPPGEEVLSHAFEPFFTTKSRGSGLGLGLVKRIVEEHGGTVDLRSIKAGGACLMITLPGGD